MNKPQCMTIAQHRTIAGVPHTGPEENRLDVSDRSVDVYVKKLGFSGNHSCRVLRSPRGHIHMSCLYIHCCEQQADSPWGGN